MASGDTLWVWKAYEGIPFSTSYPTADQRNGTWVLDYDASSKEEACFLGTLPSNYAGGALTLSVRTMATSSTANTFVLGGAIERRHVAGDDFDADSFASEQQSGGVAPSTTSGIKVAATISFSSGANMDSMVAGDDFRLKLARLVADSSDTMAGDLEVETLYLTEA